MDDVAKGTSVVGFRLQICAKGATERATTVLCLDRVSFLDEASRHLGEATDIAVDCASLESSGLAVDLPIPPEAVSEALIHYRVVHDGAERPQEHAVVKLGARVETDSPWRDEFRFEVNVEALADGTGSPFKIAPTRPDDGIAFDLSSHPDRTLTLSALFKGLNSDARFHLNASNLGEAGRIVLSEHDPGGLPELLTGQRAFGGAIHVASDQAPLSGARLTLPYAPNALRSAGMQPGDLVVLALDDKGTRYREIQPITVDEDCATLTIVADAFSYFFPGSPGIRIDAPKLYRNNIGELVGYSSRPELAVIGEVSDERAVVDVENQRADRAGATFGRGGLTLPIAGERVITVTARLPNRVPHTAHFVVRRHPPPKRVDFAAPLFGQEVVVDGVNRPYVTYATLVDSGSTESDDIEALLAGDWSRLLPHHGYRLSRMVIDDGDIVWRSLDASNPTELREELAAAVIAGYQRLPIGGLPQIVPAAPQPADTRSIRTITEFLANRQENFPVIAALFGVLREQRRSFALGALAHSPNAPIAALPDREAVGIAYVHATAGGVDAARRSALANPLRDLLGYATPVRVTVRNADGEDEERIEEMHLEPLTVAAGRLIFVEIAPYAEGQPARKPPERVAEGIWCARLVLKINPETRLPVIAAIGVADDVEGSPRSRLLLYRRQQDGRWAETLVDDTRAYVDVDMALETDGEPRIVAAAAAEPTGTHRIFEITRSGSGWTVQPLLWSLSGVAENNIGACPRIVIDFDNRSVLGLITNSAASPRFIAGVKRGGRWRFLDVGTITITDLFGSPLTDTVGQRGGQVVQASGRSLSHFSPALASLRRNEVCYAYGGGAIHLAVIDTDATTIRDQRTVDVDRSTGFAPAIARRTNPACAMVYQDLWGRGSQRSYAALQPLHFFSTDAGPFLPEGNEPTDAPIFRRRRLDLTSMFEDRGLGCGLLNPARAGDNVRSLIFNNVFDLRLYPEGSGPLPYLLGYWYTHNRVADMIWRLPRYTPAITQLSILSTRAGDDIDRVDILIPGVMMELKPKVADDLNAGRFTLGPAFQSHGLALNERPPGTFRVEIRQLNPDPNGNATEWEVVATDPFVEDRSLSGVVQYIDGSFSDLPTIIYRLTTVGDRITTSTRPIISISQPTDPDPRVVAHYKPCGVPQPLIDEGAGDLSAQVNEAFDFDLGDDFGVDTIDFIGLSGIRVSSATWISNGGRQQGALKVVVSIAQIFVRGSEQVDIGLTTETIDFRAQSRGASTLDMEIAPFVSDVGNVRWYVRRVDLNLTQFDVNVGIGFGQALLAAILGSGLTNALLNLLSPGLAGLGATAAWSALFADPIADAVTTGIINERTFDFDTGGTSGFVRDLVQEYSDGVLRAAFVPAVEGCFLDGPFLHLIHRQAVDEGVPDWRFIRSTPLNFGHMPTGGQPAVMLAAIQNFGSVPATIVAVDIEDQSTGLTLVDPPMLPIRVEVGGFLDIRLQFDPVVPGTHQTNLVARDLSGRTVRLPIWATAAPPWIDVTPQRLSFASVPANAVRTLPVRVANSGQGALTVTGLHASDPAFAPTAAAPVVVRAGEHADIDVRFSAPGQPGPVAGVLTIASNAPNGPSISVDLFALVRPAGTNILLNVTAIDFPAFPVDPNWPPIAAHYRTLQINNVGVEAVTILGPSFRVLDNSGQPSVDLMVIAGNIASNNPQPRPLQDETIAAGSMLEIVVRFRPTHPGRITGTINLAFAGATPSIAVPVSGEGV